MKLFNNPRATRGNIDLGFLFLVNILATGSLLIFQTHRQQDNRSNKAPSFKTDSNKSSDLNLHKRNKKRGSVLFSALMWSNLILCISVALVKFTMRIKR